MGGWIIIAGCRSSGLRPTPSEGTGCEWANGVTRNTSNAQKNAAMPSSTAVAYGAISRARPRRMRRIALDQTVSSSTHRSNDPSCDAQIAEAR